MKTVPGPWMFWNALAADRDVRIETRTLESNDDRNNVACVWAFAERIDGRYSIRVARRRRCKGIVKKLRV